MPHVDPLVTRRRKLDHEGSMPSERRKHSSTKGQGKDSRAEDQYDRRPLTAHTSAQTIEKERHRIVHEEGEEKQRTLDEEEEEEEDDEQDEAEEAEAALATAASAGRRKDSSDECSAENGSGFQGSDNASTNSESPEGSISDPESSSSLSQQQQQREQRAQHQILRTTAFGTLAEAQDRLHPSASRRFDPATASVAATEAANKDPQKLRALRERLAELHARRNPQAAIPTSDVPTTRFKESTSTNTTTTSSSKAPPHSRRTDKHAPTTLSSKHAVPRARPAVSTTGHIHDAHALNTAGKGDPRFSAAVVGAPADREKLKRKYGFLREYADKELEEMKKAVGAAKKAAKISTMGGKKERKKARRKHGGGGAGMMDEEALARLQVEIGRRENRLREEKRRDKEAEVRRAHKREERGKVKEGKKPFYLKRGQVKEKVESEVWEEMGARARKKAERRRSDRREGKEKRLMPGGRRSLVGETGRVV